MILTEEEAKTKWCPHVRQTDRENVPTSNRFDEDNNPTYARCIASECSAWRWVGMLTGGCGSLTDPDTGSRAFVRENIVQNRLGPIHATETENRKWIGYCGLAGKPE